MIRKATSALALEFSLIAGCASMTAPAPAQVTDGILTGKNGMTLYTFDRDVAASGKSVCNGPCATNWPPLMAAAAAAPAGDYSAAPAGDYSVITRDDGGKQIAYKGKPLYYWIKDTKAGDKTGDGVNNVWHLVKP